MLIVGGYSLLYLSVLELYCVILAFVLIFVPQVLALVKKYKAQLPT